MASLDDLKKRIVSVKSTQKITKAMEMVAASKMRKAQDRMMHSRPYYKRIKNVIAHCCWKSIVNGLMIYVYIYNLYKLSSMFDSVFIRLIFWILC